MVTTTATMTTTATKDKMMATARLFFRGPDGGKPGADMPGMGEPKGWFWEFGWFCHVMTNTVPV